MSLMTKLTLNDPHNAWTDFKQKIIFQGGIWTCKISIYGQHITTVATER